MFLRNLYLSHTKISTTQIYVRVLEQKIGNDILALKEKPNISNLINDNI